MRVAVLLTLAASIAGCAMNRPADTGGSPDWNEIPLRSGIFHPQAASYRVDTIEIPIEANGELEYKLGMREGNAIVYQWRAIDLADPGQLLSEFHGHTERVGSAPGTLMFYRKATGDSEHGSLVAPFTGIHGWYLKNSTDRPIVVRLQVAGFYDVIPQ